MARKITTGVVGKNVLGDLSTSANTISSVIEDDDIIIDPAGQGEILAEANVFIQDQKLLKFGDSDASNWIGIRSPTTVSSNVTLTLPATAGTSGYVLTTNGSGTLSWENVAVQVADNVASDTNFYNLALTTATSGGINELKVVSSKIDFKPSDGTLRLKASTASSNTTTGALIVTGGVGIAGNCNVGLTLSATTVTETSSIVLKDNIMPIDNALNKVLDLMGVTYTRKSTGKYEAGLIAEDVEKVLPELVDSEGQYKSINYSRLSAYLIEAIKDIKTQLDSLKNG